MDVFPGGEIHHGVSAPFGGPAHFFDFFIDGGCDCAVADIGVDFHEKIAPDDHGLELRVIDVAGNDSASAGNLGTNKFGSDQPGDLGAVCLTGVLVIHHIARHLLGWVDLTWSGHFVALGS